MAKGTITDSITSSSSFDEAAERMFELIKNGAASKKKHTIALGISGGNSNKASSTNNMSFTSSFLVAANYNIPPTALTRLFSDLVPGQKVLVAPWIWGGGGFDLKHMTDVNYRKWTNGMTAGASSSPFCWGPPGAEILATVSADGKTIQYDNGGNGNYLGLTDSLKSAKLADFNMMIEPDYRTAQGSVAPSKAFKPKKPSAKELVTFDSVIMADDAKGQILETIGQVDNHKLIFETWGFDEIFEKGTAISMLFWGGPGTGKTLMSKAIADKFGYKLEVIGTAEIETPEPGGAERNIKKVFADAADGKTVLLFDEADSLVGDRKNVGMILAAQINCLLTELEQFTGIVIFTTNRAGTLDPAFERRLSLKLEFPMPDASQRLLIWKRMFPSKAPLDKDIRWDDLANIEIAGGHIKNVVLSTARIAAHRKLKKITDAVIWEALEKEVSSSESFTREREHSGQWYGSGLPNHGHDFKRAEIGTKEISRG